MADFKRCIGIVLLFLCIAMAVLSFCWFYPSVVSTCIAAFWEVTAGFKSFLTPPRLFLIMNVVVLILAFTSGVIRQRPSDRQHRRSDAGELHEAGKENCRRQAVEVEDDGGNEGDAEEGRVDAIYPEVLSSFFGDGTTSVTRRKPILKGSVMSSSYNYAGKRGRPITSGTSLPQSSPASLFTLSNPGLIKGTSKVQLPPSDLVPPSLNMAAGPARSRHGGEDRDVDQRADAFIGDFYMRMKLQQVDPYMERLDRSYGS